MFLLWLRNRTRQDKKQLNLVLPRRQKCRESNFSLQQIVVYIVYIAYFICSVTCVRKTLTFVQMAVLVRRTQTV